ncbi:MAG TPA: DUF2752 domain-containing protein [Blastocatellia bacterium]|nr:DUF2752 domain-containing protein [Blastocatellia bacterium]
MPNLFAPILASLLKQRAVVLVLLGVAALQLICTAFDVSIWRCPMLHTLGIPCPGCGLTRATLAFLHGDWRQGLTLHAFGLFMPLVLVLISGGLLPAHLKQQYIFQVEKIESRTGIVALLLLALVGYWLVRLLIFPATFIRVVFG